MKGFEYDKIVGGIIYGMRGSLPKNIVGVLGSDDLFQVGRLAAWLACSAYDKSKGVPLLAYIALRVRWAILDEVRLMDYIPRGVREKIKTNEVGAVAFSGTQVGYAEEFCNKILGDLDQPYSAYLHVELLDFLCLCDAEPYPGILLAYAAGISKRDLATFHGVSKTNMSGMVNEKKRLFSKLIGE